VVLLVPKSFQNSPKISKNALRWHAPKVPKVRELRSNARVDAQVKSTKGDNINEM